MQLGQRFKQWASYGAVALTAAASIATSEATWRVEDAAGPFNLVLDTNAPEEARHFTVKSSERHGANLVAKVHWDDSLADPIGAVRLRLVRDGGDPVERVVRKDELDKHGKPLPVSAGISEDAACAAAPCEQGYTATLTMVDGHPDEKLTIEWSFEASIGGTGNEEPAGAFVTVTED